MKNLFAPPRDIVDPNECDFYHTMEIPGYGLVKGEWDLRGKFGTYLGNVSLQGKTVLEIGTASGGVCFYMEQQGAQVIAYDLDENYMVDVVPTRYDYAQFIAQYPTFARKRNNGFWLAHRALQSQAKVIYGTVYAIPLELEPVDISTFGCVLLHLRDPFLALQNALKFTRETVIITEPIWDRERKERLNKPVPAMEFISAYWLDQPTVSWWTYSPEIIKRFIAALGFEKAEVTYHNQKFQGKEYPLFTVVGHRTHPI